MNISFNIEIVKKGKWYIARAPELDFVTQGASIDEARKNILELIDIQFRHIFPPTSGEPFFRVVS
jgi:predicted RNase H-like HicB family nuclease